MKFYSRGEACLFYVCCRKVKVTYYYATTGYPCGNLQQVAENTKLDLRREATGGDTGLGDVLGVDSWDAMNDLRKQNVGTEV